MHVWNVVWFSKRVMDETMSVHEYSYDTRGQDGQDEHGFAVLNCDSACTAENAS